MNDAPEKTTEAMIHLICGSTGAGKSTYAKSLKNDLGTIHFAIDDWMTSLFGPDLENPMDWQWISERALRCEQQMISTACALAKTGASSVLEIGLQEQKKRAEVATTIKQSGCQLQIHYLDVDSTERWRRVQLRNSEKGETFSLEVTRELFDFFEDMWESPSENEQAAFKRVNTSGGSSQ